MFAKLNKLHSTTLVGKNLHGAESFLKSKQFLSSSTYSTILMSPKFHYPVHKGPQLVPTLSPMHPVYTFPFHLFYFYFNIISQSTPRSSKWSFFLQISSQKICMHFSFPLIPVTYPNHLLHMPFTGSIGILLCIS